MKGRAFEKNTRLPLLLLLSLAQFSFCCLQRATCRLAGCVPRASLLNVHTLFHVHRPPHTHTPLHVVRFPRKHIQEGRVAAVSVLLALGADPNAATPRGVRPLHSASQNGHVRIVHLLMAYGADSTLATQSGATAAKLAADFGHGEPSQVYAHPLAPNAPLQKKNDVFLLRPCPGSRRLLSSCFDCERVHSFRVAWCPLQCSHHHPCSLVVFSLRMSCALRLL
jgi:hypothetical protein